MKTISVKAVKRADFGKKAAKAIRREGMVPCVLCGNGETETFSVDPREIKPLIYTPNSYIVEFDIEGKKEQAVQCAIFEADGGAWKNEAMSRIKNYLALELSEYPQFTVIS